MNIKRSIVFLLVLLVLLPRLALLFNGLDSQRIWDTNTPAAFQALQAAKEANIGSFLATPHKYPLLGSLIYIPTVGGYYLVKMATGAFPNADDFMDAYALGATNLFFWIRFEVLLINLAALWLLYHTAKRFLPEGKTVGLIAVGFAAADVYVTLFAVEPRIHSLVFFATILVIYTSFLLLEKKTLRNYMLAFGAAGVAASIAQSGFIALILPLSAHAYEGVAERWKFRSFSQPLLVGLVFFIVITALVGYPAVLARFFGIAPIAPILLGGEHQSPVIDPGHGFRFLWQFFVLTIPAITWVLLAGWWQRFAVRTQVRIGTTPYDVLFIAPIIIFLAIFGFLNVTTGRFALVIMPALCLLAATILVRLAAKKSILYITGGLAVMQVTGIVALALIGLGGDTRAEAATWLLMESREGDRILTTIDNELLGIVPTFSSVKTGDSGPAGSAEKRIMERELKGQKSRQLTWWNTAEGVREDELRSYTYAVVAADDPQRFLEVDALDRQKFRLVKTITAHRSEEINVSSIPWDAPTPFPSLPLSLSLWQFRAMGPTVFIYERI